ncbi:MAG: copper transporter [Phycicoccus sp.]|nr:copper transporter [Phycicoccus sp.]
MIDFRYHLVSIASIFVALAVGIVLGAGPLQQQIGSTLTAEVTQLREDKASLRAEVDALNAQAAAHEDFDDDALPRIVAGSLGGQIVTIVALPGVDQGLIDRTATTLQAGGATVAHRVAVQPTWVNAGSDAVAARQAAALAGASALGLTTDAAGAATTLNEVLAASLLGGGGAVDDPQVRRTVLDALVSADLIDTDAAPAITSTSVIILSAVITDGDSADRLASAQAWLALSVAFDQRSTGTVVVSELDGEATDADSLLGTLRSTDSARADISGIDNGGSTIGQASVDFALAEQVVGGAGQYGLLGGVDAAYAPIPSS